MKLKVASAVIAAAAIISVSAWSLGANEKLQLQMWGEMMQRMGEIASKYAVQVK